ncbi:MAG: hypothetical protein A2Y40_04315 [Candidatus Margulisbacteria bacterium GWF2_35_9]|nr:MAG: hypothetical protein A2Y40_04315 [Candidatus Margulisbacteria bacterium GWF2_35_9]
MVFEKRVPISTGHKINKNKMGHSYQLKRKRRDKILNIFKTFAKIFGAIFGVVSIIILIYIVYLVKTLPDVTVITNIIPNETTKIYSADGFILADLHKEENRIIVPYSKISNTMKKSVVALEDIRFYKHHGVDPIGILRAVFVDIQRGGLSQGASTITQQLARHLFLTKKKKIQRKIAEMVLAVKIERHYTKEEILSMYLNQVYWGHNAYGIESASKQYFNKSASDLSIAESAMLVGMLQAPEYYSPYRSFDRAMKRKNIVLESLYNSGIVSRAEYLDAKQATIVISDRKKLKYKAPYFTSMVIEKLTELYGEDAVYSSGMKVYTPLNYRMQEAAEVAVEEAIKTGQQASLNYTQAAILAIDPRTGYIVTMVGGYDFLNNHFNKTTQAKRQPGSSFKPFVYLTALSKNLSPGTIFDDAPVTFNTLEGPYAPQNYEMNFSGKLPMRKALEKSINVVAIKIIDIIHPESVSETARKLGITTTIEPVLSMALGSQEISMMEMTSAYGVFATGGDLAKPISILKVEDRNGILLYQEKIETKTVFDSNVIYALVEMMKGVVNYGTGRNAKLPRPMAGKTGTTTDYKDAWFIGYVPQLVVATWVGNDDNTPMKKVTGGYIPAIMWKNYMKTALANIPMMDFPKPRGMVGVSVCWDTGNKSNEYCPQTSIEKFWVGYEPKEYCSLHNEKNQGLPKETKKGSSWINDFLN